MAIMGKELGEIVTRGIINTVGKMGNMKSELVYEIMEILGADIVYGQN